MNKTSSLFGDRRHRRAVRTIAWFLGFAIPIAFFANHGVAQTANWTGATNSNWFESTNWDTGTVPNGTTFNAIVGSPSPTDVNGNVVLNSLVVDANGVVNVLSSLNLDFGGTATTTLTNQGTINVFNNSDLQFLNNVVNSGTITVNSGGNLSDIEVAAAGATLSGGGTVTLTNGASRVMGLTGATLTIDNQTINGFGQVGANSLAITNNAGGLIDANVSGSRLVFDAVGSTTLGATNMGTMQASSGGILTIQNSHIDNTGGSIIAQAGSTVELGHITTIVGGTLSGPGSFQQLSSSNILLADVTNSSTIDVGNNSDFAVSGTLTNSGTVSINSVGNVTDMAVQAGGFTLTGGGTVALTHDSSRVMGVSGATLTIDNQTINGFGQLGANSLNITNTAGGLIDANSNGKRLVFDAAGSTTLGATNMGTMQASSGGILRFQGSFIDNTGGSIIAQAGSTVELGNITTIVGGTLSGPGSFQQLSSSNILLTDVTNSSTIDVGNNSDFAVSGTLTNSGTVSINSAGNTTDMEVQTGVFTLTGGGTVALTHDASRIMGVSGAEISVADQVISGFGQIGANSLVITNTASGLIDANSNGKRLVFDAAGSTTVGATNMGTIQASSGGILTIQDSFVDNTGGSIIAQAGSTVELGNVTTIVGGTLSGPGSFQQLSSTNILLTDVTNSSTIDVGNNSDFAVSGTLTNSGTVSINSAGNTTDMEVQTGGFTLTGGGTVTLTNGASRIMGVSGATLTIDNQTINGFGQLGANSLAITNNAGGIVDADVNGQTLTVDPAGASSTVFSNVGTLRASNGGILNVLHDVNNAGTMDAQMNSLITAANITSDTTSLFTGEGIIRSTGTLFNIDGTVAPGSSPGTLTLESSASGSIDFASTADVQIELASLAMFDQLVLNTDAVNLDGVLGVTLLNGYTPDSTDSFTILQQIPFNSGSISGFFANVGNGDTLQTLDGGGFFTVTYNANSIVLSNFSAVPEPGMLGMFAAVTGVILVRRRRR